MFGNFGIAILVFTLGVKLLFYPIAARSYRSMGKMRLLGPKITQVRERYKDDPAKLQSEMMAVYKAENVSPVSGCAPMLLQIPVFFALYKVILVTIEMRQAPFFGWIHDLSATDPTNIFNLFGLIPIDPSTFSPLPASRHLAARHGRHHVLPAKTEPTPTRPRASAHAAIHAPDLHVFHGPLPGRPGDLLVLEQHPDDGPAMVHPTPATPVPDLGAQATAG